MNGLVERSGKKNNNNNNNNNNNIVLHNVMFSQLQLISNKQLHRKIS